MSEFYSGRKCSFFSRCLKSAAALILVLSMGITSGAARNSANTADSDGYAAADVAGEIPPPQNPEQSKPTTISGTIISAANYAPMAGVTVFVEGTSVGVVSDAEGNYTIKVPAGTKEITFAMVGYDTKKIQLANIQRFKLVEMTELSNKIDDIVVVGFGTQKKESLVGAVQAVDPKNLTATSSNLTTAFAGNIAGMIARQTSGEPGNDAASFYIRGAATFGSSRAALIVLDGVEITSAMLNSIAPESIESFSVLKDATATALYGSRGANGVVIVTTKEGRNADKMSVRFTLENTFSMPTKVQEVADGVTYMQLYNEATWNDTPLDKRGAYEPFYSDEKIEGTRRGLNPYIYPNNDWYKMMFKNLAVNQRFNMSVSGGSKRVNYFMNASIFNENGIIKEPKESTLDIHMNNQKYLFQNNVTAALTKTTKVSLKINTQLNYNTSPIEATSDLFYYTMRANPVRFPAVLPAEEGDTYVRYGNNRSWDSGDYEMNPYALLSRGYKKKYYSYLTSAFSVDQDFSFITKGLSAKALVSFYNYTSTTTNRNIVPFYFRIDDDYRINPDGTYDFTTSSLNSDGNTYLTSSVSHGGQREWSFSGTIDYARKFGKHDVAATAVYHMKEKMLNATGADEEKILPFREQGIAGRITYNFDKRYLVEANFGYNGSENFTKGNRFGFFPSVALGWTVSNEKFFKPLKEVVSNFKIRGSYGLSGNDALDIRFPYLTIVDMTGGYSYYFGNNFSSVKGAGVSTYGNPDATWEVAKKLNVGVDLGLFDNSLELSVDYFQEKRTDIFMQRQSLSATAGLSANTPYGNIGAVDNAGVDLSLSYRKAFKKDVILTVRGTFTYAHNEVQNYDEPEYAHDYMSRVGKPINSFHVLVAEGLFTSQEEIDSSPKQTFGTYAVGDIKYKDMNDDKIIDANDMVYTADKSSLPEIVYGFGASLNIRRWDVSLFFQGTGKSWLRMYNHDPFATSSRRGFGIVQYIADDHWSETNPNPNAEYPRLTSLPSTNNTTASTFYLRDAHFLRLKNAEVGYTLKSFRFYAAGSNLFTLSPFKHWDPEKGGGNGLSYPLQRTVKIGVQYKF